MADEQTTDVTNSSPAIPTVEPVATDTTTSTTDQTPDPSASQPEPSETATSDEDTAGDPLDDSAGGLAAEAAKPEGEDDAAAPTNEFIGAPEGDYELELPEGMEVDTAALEAFAPVAKEIGLSNKGLAELAAKGVPVVEGMVQKAMVSSVVAQRKAWETDGRAFVQGGTLADGTEVTASPVFAGQNMDAVMSISAKAIDRFASNETGEPLLFPNSKVNPETGEMEPGTFRDFLKTTGLGNHPAMLFAFYKAGQAISEDSFESHSTTPTTKLTREEKYYPHKAT